MANGAFAIRLKKIVSFYGNKYCAFTELYRDFLKVIGLDDDFLNGSNHTFNLRTRFNVDFNAR
jgi:hypothetical protein